MYKNIISILTRGERKKLIRITLLSLLMALLDMVGISTLLPFVSVVSNPNVVKENSMLSWAFNSIQFDSVENFIFFLGIVVFVSIVTSVVVKIIVLRIQLEFVYDREYTISKRLLESHLSQPYEWFLGKSSSELVKNVLADVNSYVNSALLPLMNLISNFLLLIAILSLLLFIDVNVTLFSIIFFGIFYGVIFKFSSKYLRNLGKRRDSANEVRYSIIAGVFASIKEVKLTRLEKEFSRKYDHPANEFARMQSSAQIVNLFPRYGIEILAFGGLVLFILYFINNRTLTSLIPTLSVFTFAAFRLMPVLQNVFGSLNAMRFSGGITNQISVDLAAVKYTDDMSTENVSLISNEDLFKVSLQNISYSYPGVQKLVLNNLNIEFSSHQTIAIVGLSGSGKTTLVDIIIGLLKPVNGSIYVGNVSLDDSCISSWQRSIGYVPQDIFLIEDSFASNIAFGVPTEDIDLALLERAAQAAAIDEFIASFDTKYDTIVGAGGIRLSGGQRQRIGLARAFYKEPKLLVLDEATSSLDSLTEKSVMDTVYGLSNITRLIITHKLETIVDCDIIYMIKDGYVLDFGTYDYMIDNCGDFYNLALETK